MDVAGQPFPLPAGRLDLGGVLALRLDLGREPGQVADDHPGQQQQHDAVEGHAERDPAYQRQVAAGHDHGRDQPARLP